MRRGLDGPVVACRLAWGNMKLHLWLVWRIAVVAYFTAAHMLASHAFDQMDRDRPDLGTQKLGNGYKKTPQSGLNV
jgi:hypothetical protein